MIKIKDLEPDKKRKIKLTRITEYSLKVFSNRLRLFSRLGQMVPINLSS
jgi:hypothetical protein